MERIILIYMIVTGYQIAQSKPINNGFTLKFYPVSVKEDLKPKTFGALFAKIPQEPTKQETALRREILSNDYFTNSTDICSGCTNQIGKIIYPKRSFVKSNVSQGANFINVPIIGQHFSDYKIIVAVAPWNVKMSGDKSKPVVIYVVFPEDEDPKSINIPSIYFVKQSRRLDGKHVQDKGEKVDPVIIIDSNRTVTGLKSKEVNKVVKFNSKLNERYNYEVTR